MNLESEEWAMEDPGNWAVILAEMQKNVQSRAASFLGHVPHDRSDHHRPINPHTSKQSGPKVYISLLQPPLLPFRTYQTL
jgi:hypothetical protein